MGKATLQWLLLGLLTASIGSLMAQEVDIPPASSAPSSSVQRITLDNGHLQLTVTPDLGGRGLALHRIGQPNLLKVGEAVAQQPHPQVSAEAGDIGYLGHDVWVGPQSGWWQQQQVNPQRQQAHANWPPDPYLGFARNRVLLHTEQVLQLEGVNSPVSGIRMQKQYGFDPNDPDTVQMQASARNIRSTSVAWDLWFNTRVSSATRVFVPLASAADLQMQALGDPGTESPAYRLQHGLLILAPAEREQAQRGKFLLQPSAGWMAGFNGKQMLLFRFQHQPRERIHPEHGQIELYVDAASANTANGLIEMELHAPYQLLTPGRAMQATERWTVLAYDGPDDAGAQQQFLCQQATRLKLAGACID